MSDDEPMIVDGRTLPERIRDIPDMPDQAKLTAGQPVFWNKERELYCNSEGVPFDPQPAADRTGQPRKLVPLGEMNFGRKFEPSDLIDLVRPTVGEVVDLDKIPPPWIDLGVWDFLGLTHVTRRLRVVVADIIQDNASLQVTYEDEQ